MLDISFSEIAVIGAVALVVLGPERLPKVARTAGHLFGRLQRYVATVKADINREMDASELSKVKSEFQSAAQDLQSTLKSHANAIEADVRDIEQQVAKSSAVSTAAPANAITSPITHNAPVPASTAIANAARSQADIIAEQDAAMGFTNMPPLDVPNVTSAAIQSVQQSFDFGVEAPRKIAR